jgi:ribosomal protein S18 acetylase RimI-like enzyme
VVTFRSARADDVPLVAALVQAAFRGEASRKGWTTEADLLDGQRTDEAALREIVDQLVLAEDEGGLVGCCRVDDTGYIGMISIAPARQATGVGRRLLAEAERRARRAGATRARMTVIRQRTELIAWYERRGYHRTGETEPFPYGDERFGLPKRDDLEFVVLEKGLL